MHGVVCRSPLAPLSPRMPSFGFRLLDPVGYHMRHYHSQWVLSCVSNAHLRVSLFLLCALLHVHLHPLPRCARSPGGLLQHPLQARLLAHMSALDASRTSAAAARAPLWHLLRHRGKPSSSCSAPNSRRPRGEAREHLGSPRSATARGPMGQGPCPPWHDPPHECRKLADA